MAEALQRPEQRLLRELTICSVSYHSGLHLQLNWELTTRAAGPVRWLVVQNGPPEPLDTFEVLPGVARPQLALPPDGTARVNGASYHHALALNSALGWLDSRFVLFLDPDFYIVPPLGELLDHMVRHELAFFGAPYAIDPARPRIQGFPCAFCMLVDGSRVDLRSLDFLPDASRRDVMADTGYRIYSHYVQTDQTGLRYEAVLPAAPSGTPWPHSTRRFAEWCGEDALRGLTADEYFWRDRPFGLHLHMKLHIHRLTAGPAATKAWAKQQLGQVRRAMEGARRHGALV
jgi:hypothetical protein